jgi:hypothetical protein
MATYVFAVLSFFLLPVAQGAGTMSASERETIEQAILAVSAQMTVAGQARDVEGLFGFMLDTDKGSVIQNGIVLLTRSEALEQTRRNMSRISSIGYKWKQQHVTVLSPTVALLVSEGETSAATQDGQSFTGAFAQTVVFVLSGGKWKAIHAHQSSPGR